MDQTEEQKAKEVFAKAMGMEQTASPEVTYHPPPVHPTNPFLLVLNLLKILWRALPYFFVGICFLGVLGSISEKSIEGVILFLIAAVLSLPLFNRWLQKIFPTIAQVRASTSVVKKLGKSLLFILKPILILSCFIFAIGYMTANEPYVELQVEKVPTITYEKTITFKGKVFGQNPKLTVNGTPIEVKDNTFTYTTTLQPLYNNFSFQLSAKGKGRKDGTIRDGYDEHSYTVKLSDPLLEENHFSASSSVGEKGTDSDVAFYKTHNTYSKYSFHCSVDLKTVLFKDAGTCTAEYTDLKGSDLIMITDENYSAFINFNKWNAREGTAIPITITGTITKGTVKLSYVDGNKKIQSITAKVGDKINVKGNSMLSIGGYADWTNPADSTTTRGYYTTYPDHAGLNLYSTRIKVESVGDIPVTMKYTIGYDFLSENYQ